MYYVKELAYREGSLRTTLHNTLYEGLPRESQSLCITCEDSVTKEQVSICSNHWMEFEHFIQKYSPIGCGLVPSSPTLPIKTRECIALVTVSSLSLRLQSYVESVELKQMEAGSPTAGMFMRAHDSGERIRFHVVDAQKSVFIYINGLSYGMFPCTLFEIMCYYPMYWQDDAYYIYHAQDVYFSGVGFCSVPAAYQVRFKDVAKVRTLMGKAAALDINPLRDYFREP